MGGAEELQRTFDMRYRELGLAETELGIACDATLRGLITGPVRVRPEPEPAEPKAAWTHPDPEKLPKISLAVSSRAPTRASTPPDASAGPPDLELEEVIGEGGMGRIHGAHQRSLEREVAVKTLKTHPAGELATTALLREAVITGRLEHPGIVPVHALGVDDRGAPVLVMKRIEGVEWRALLHDPNHPGWAARAGDRLAQHLEILMQICQAVHFAHSRGVIHCDIKPENVMLGEFGEVYLLDWGIALRSDDAKTVDRGLVGTPAFMAPELIGGGPIGPHTDVYLLGSTLHQILTGRFRHDGENLQQVLLAAFTSAPVDYPDSISIELAELANRATQRDPAARPKSALAFRQALADFLRHRSSIALAEEARGRLAALDSMLNRAEPDEPPADLARAYQLISECRFGFTQAQKEWADNPIAARGLSETIGFAVELELRQDHVESALALLGELERAPDSLVLRAKAAKKRQLRARAEDDRLRALDRDLDASVSKKERSRGLAAFAGATLAITFYALSYPNPSRIRPASLLVFAVVMFVGMLLVLAAFYKRFLENAFNRRVVAMMVIAGIGAITNRAIATLLGLPAWQVFTQDLLIFATVISMGAATLVKPLWASALTLLLGAIACSMWPDSSALMFAAATLINLPLGWYAFWRHSQEEELRREEAIPESRLPD